MVPGVELVVGYVSAWLVRKAKRAGGLADAEVDRAVDAVTGRLHDLVSRKLGQDPALERAREEAEEGRQTLSDRTLRRLKDSLEDAAERDEGFAQALSEAVAELLAATRAAGGTPAPGHSVTFTVGTVHAEGGSVVGAEIHGPVTTGGTVNPREPGPAKG